MRPAQEIQVRSRRRQSWFSVDNEIIDKYGPRIGCHGIAVYSALCRFVNEDSQRSTIGLTKLAEKLKVGRAKLISTLELLETEGLIDIKPGDRTHCNVYTLLEVEKGGSNENQVGNEGGSNENQVGGSNENCINTKSNKTTSSKESAFAQTVGYLDQTTQQTVQALTEIKSWDKNEAQTITLVADTHRTYPRIDLLELATTLAYKMRNGLVRNYKRPSQAFGNWAASCNERLQAQPEPTNIRSEEAREMGPEARARYDEWQANLERERRERLAEAMENLA